MLFLFVMVFTIMDTSTLIKTKSTFYNYVNQHQGQEGGSTIIPIQSSIIPVYSPKMPNTSISSEDKCRESHGN